MSQAAVSQPGVIVFNSICLGGKVLTALGSQGVVKINKDGIGWKAKSGKTVTLAASDVVSAEWTCLGPQYQLTLTSKSGTKVKLRGFNEKDRATLENALQSNFSVALTDSVLSSKGWNWGKADVINDSQLRFDVDGVPSFEIPLADISQAVNVKDEVTLEFHPDDAIEKDVDTLVELRFYAPYNKEPGNPDEEDEGEDERTPAQKFHQKLLSCADLEYSSGNGIAVFKTMPCLTPRGKYDVDMYPTFFRLHGQTYDYKINYSNIYKLTMLPRPDEKHMYFVISVDPPVRIGGGTTVYPHLVLQFSKDEELEIKINLPEEVIRDKYQGKLEPEMAGKTHIVFAKVFQVLTEKKLLRESKFLSYANGSCIRCALKANEGYLYPLERAFFFLPKPVTLISYKDIISVEFARVSSTASNTSTRNFDFVVEMKGGSGYQFFNIARQEYSNFFEFLRGKNIRIKGTKSLTAVTVDEDKSSDDEEKKPAAVAMDDDDDEDEDDEDFVDEGDDDELPPEEFDENYESPDDEDGEAGSGGGGGGDEDKEEPEAKKRKTDKKEKAKKKKASESDEE